MISKSRFLPNTPNSPHSMGTLRKSTVKLSYVNYGIAYVRAGHALTLERPIRLGLRTIMKLPSDEVLWKYIFKTYLIVPDIAAFEASMDSHKVRSMLHLTQCPLIEDKASTISSQHLPELIPYSYELLELPDSYQHDLVSSYMTSWCVQRRLRLKNIRLKYDPNPDLKDSKKQSMFFGLIKFKKPSMTNAAVAEIRTRNRSGSNASDASASVNGKSTLDWDYDDWDFFHYVEILYIDVDLSTSSCDALISRLLSIKSFNADYSLCQMKEQSYLALIQQCKWNSVRNTESQSVLSNALKNSTHSQEVNLDPCVLTHLTLDVSKISNNTIESLATMLSDIVSIKLEHCHKLNDKVLRCIANGLKKLETLAIYGGKSGDSSKKSLKAFAIKSSNKSENSETCDISDAGLEAFRNTGQHLKSVTLYSCENITSMGLSMLLVHSSKSLTELNLGHMADIDREKSLVSLINSLPALQTLGLYENPLFFTDDLLKTVAKTCKHMKSLILRTGPIYRNTFTNDGLKSLLIGCKHIEVLHLGWSQGISKAGIKYIAKRYKHSLRSFTIFGKVVDELYFADCRHNVKVIGWHPSLVNPQKTEEPTTLREPVIIEEKIATIAEEKVKDSPPRKEEYTIMYNDDSYVQEYAEQYDEAYGHDREQYYYDDEEEDDFADCDYDHDEYLFGYYDINSISIRRQILTPYRPQDPYEEDDYYDDEEDHRRDINPKYEYYDDNQHGQYEYDDGYYSDEQNKNDSEERSRKSRSFDSNQEEPVIEDAPKDIRNALDSNERIDDVSPVPIDSSEDKESLQIDTTPNDVERVVSRNNSSKEGSTKSSPTKTKSMDHIDVTEDLEYPEKSEVTSDSNTIERTNSIKRDALDHSMDYEDDVHHKDDPQINYDEATNHDITPRSPQKTPSKHDPREEYDEQDGEYYDDNLDDNSQQRDYPKGDDGSYYEQGDDGNGPYDDDQDKSSQYDRSERSYGSQYYDEVVAGPSKENGEAPYFNESEDEYYDDEEEEGTYYSGSPYYDDVVVEGPYTEDGQPPYYDEPEYLEEEDIYFEDRPVEGPFTENGEPPYYFGPSEIYIEGGTYYEELLVEGPYTENGEPPFYDGPEYYDDEGSFYDGEEGSYYDGEEGSYFEEDPVQGPYNEDGEGPYNDDGDYYDDEDEGSYYDDGSYYEEVAVEGPFTENGEPPYYDGPLYEYYDDEGSYYEDELIVEGPFTEDGEPPYYDGPLYDDYYGDEGSYYYDVVVEGPFTENGEPPYFDEHIDGYYSGEDSYYADGEEGSYYDEDSRGGSYYDDEESYYEEDDRSYDEGQDEPYEKRSDQMSDKDGSRSPLSNDKVDEGDQSSFEVHMAEIYEEDDMIVSSSHGMSPDKSFSEKKELPASKIPITPRKLKSLLGSEKSPRHRNSLSRSSSMFKKRSSDINKAMESDPIDTPMDAVTLYLAKHHSAKFDAEDLNEIRSEANNDQMTMKDHHNDMSLTQELKVEPVNDNLDDLYKEFDAIGEENLNVMLTKKQKDVPNTLTSDEQKGPDDPADTAVQSTGDSIDGQQMIEPSPTNTIQSETIEAWSSKDDEKHGENDSVITETSAALSFNSSQQIASDADMIVNQFPRNTDTIRKSPEGDISPKNRVLSVLQKYRSTSRQTRGSGEGLTARRSADIEAQIKARIIAQREAAEKKKSPVRPELRKRRYKSLNKSQRGESNDEPLTGLEVVPDIDVADIKLEDLPPAPTEFVSDEIPYIQNKGFSDMDMTVNDKVESDSESNDSEILEPSRNPVVETQLSTLYNQPFGDDEGGFVQPSFGSHDDHDKQYEHHQTIYYSDNTTIHESHQGNVSIDVSKSNDEGKPMEMDHLPEEISVLDQSDDKEIDPSHQTNSEISNDIPDQSNQSVAYDNHEMEEYDQHDHSYDHETVDEASGQLHTIHEDHEDDVYYDHHDDLHEYPEGTYVDEYGQIYYPSDEVNYEYDPSLQYHPHYDPELPIYDMYAAQYQNIAYIDPELLPSSIQIEYDLSNMSQEVYDHGEYVYDDNGQIYEYDQSLIDQQGDVYYEELEYPGHDEVYLSPEDIANEDGMETYEDNEIAEENGLLSPEMNHPVLNHKPSFILSNDAIDGISKDLLYEEYDHENRENIMEEEFDEEQF